MKILVVTFDHNYYLWQSLVQINNFIKYGYDQDIIYLIASSNPSPVLKAMMNSDKIKAKFYIYKDERINSKYPSSLRPFLLEKLFTDYPELEKEVIFYIDPDVVFTKKLDFTDMINDDYWHVSDTRGYLDSKYIKNTSDKLFNEMCDIVGISPEVIINNDSNAGGAQYLMKGLNANYWKKVYKDSEELYSHMKNTENLYQKKIQIWTADMWSVFWNAIYFGYKVKINRKLNFCWAPWSKNMWDETYIFHNAGIFDNNTTDFCKIHYQNSPFYQELKVDEKNCTFNYVKEIKETENNFQDIIRFF